MHRDVPAPADAEAPTPQQITPVPVTIHPAWLSAPPPLPRRDRTFLSSRPNLALVALRAVARLMGWLLVAPALLGAALVGIGLSLTLPMIPFALVGFDAWLGWFVLWVIDFVILMVGFGLLAVGGNRRAFAAFAEEAGR